MRREHLLLIHQLTFVELLVVVALVARTLLLYGLGDIIDYQWLCTCESWLDALGIRLMKAVEDEQRAA